MKKWFLVLGFLTLATTSSQAQTVTPEDIGYQDVPRDHWSAVALQHLARQQLFGDYPPEHFVARPLSRYEIAVAVATAQTLDAGLNSKIAFSPTFDRTTLRDVLVSLVFEYRDEIVRLNNRHPWIGVPQTLIVYEEFKAKHTLTPVEWFDAVQTQPWLKNKPSNLPANLRNIEARSVLNRTDRSAYTEDKSQK